MTGSPDKTKRLLTVFAILLGLIILGMILFSETCEEDGCYRLTSALRWLGKALSML